MPQQPAPHVTSSSTAAQRQCPAINALSKPSARRRTNTLTTGFLLIALFQLLCCATTPAEAQTTTTTAATTTKVTVNGKVFYVFVPTDRGQTVTLPSAVSALGGIAVLGATIDVDEGGNSNVGGGTIDKPASGNGAPSRSFSLLTSSLALSATFGGLIWTIADLGLL